MGSIGITVPPAGAVPKPLKPPSPPGADGVLMPPAGEKVEAGVEAGAADNGVLTRNELGVGPWYPEGVNMGWASEPGDEREGSDRAREAIGSAEADSVLGPQERSLFHMVSTPDLTSVTVGT